MLGSWSKALLPLLLFANFTLAQEVPIIDYSVNSYGQVKLEVNSTSVHYYILKVRNEPTGDFDIAASITLGLEGKTTITEALRNYPIEHYQVLEYRIDEPFDTDDDGTDDITELEAQPDMNPLNAAQALDIEDGAVILDSFGLFNQLSISAANVQFVEFLNGKRYAKFVIAKFDEAPEIYFMNSSTHNLHADFISAKNIDVSGTLMKGQIVYHPTTVSNNGTIGTFAFNFSDGHGEDFEVLQRTHELLAASMPYLKNNFSYYVTERSEDEYERDSALIAASRIPVITEEEVFGEVDYWGLNQREGYGFFRVLEAGVVPDARDIVLLNALPNDLPRVGGIITSVLQTPLSHINLRAIQDGIPNAFIRDPLAVDSIADLLNSYVYFKVASDHFTLRAATQTEVDAWFDALRPSEVQYSPMNLDFKFILPLDDISFSMYDGFGHKCANVATMRNFGFANGTVPDGFGVPYYFYHEYMKYNGFVDELKSMLSDSDFMSDRTVREQRLLAFADQIKKGSMPSWMLKDLAAMQTSFPRGTSIRCRSSSNTEDVPGFHGAGLYDSKTHHPDEGHIEKSIKQVYASLWNLRAFDEREFYRIDHYSTSMGVLCHPNYSDEKANGVGVSTDPIYQTYQSFFYLNTQIGEDLITNPGAESVPEEILLDREQKEEHDYILLRSSSLAEGDEVILSHKLRSQLRTYLTEIHEQFQLLYDAEGNETFAMEIEFKVTSEGELAIKQARPWVSFVPSEDSDDPDVRMPSITVYPNPTSYSIQVRCEDCRVVKLLIATLTGEIKREVQHDYRSDLPTEVSVADLAPGVYLMLGIQPDGSVGFSSKFIKTD
ncbi:MAG: PEP/pyruvate-binding domain-containing protein [Cryomorphaceae bacterium]